MRVGFTDAELFDLTAIDPWFLAHIRTIITAEEGLLRRGDVSPLGPAGACKQHGLRPLTGRIAATHRVDPEDAVRAPSTCCVSRRGEPWPRRPAPVYARVDAPHRPHRLEFVAHTPYLYSTYETESEAAPNPDKRKVVILGGGPNRIGQGIEFDYCCVHAVAWRCGASASRP